MDLSRRPSYPIYGIAYTRQFIHFCHRRKSAEPFAAMVDSPPVGWMVVGERTAGFRNQVPSYPLNAERQQIISPHHYFDYYPTTFI